MTFIILLSAVTVNSGGFTPAEKLDAFLNEAEEESCADPVHDSDKEAQQLREILALREGSALSWGFDRLTREPKAKSCNQCAYYLSTNRDAEARHCLARNLRGEFLCDQDALQIILQNLLVADGRFNLFGEQQMLVNGLDYYNVPWATNQGFSEQDRVQMWLGQCFVETMRFGGYLNPLTTMPTGVCFNLGARIEEKSGLKLPLHTKNPAPLGSGGDVANVCRSLDLDQALVYTRRLANIGLLSSALACGTRRCG